MPLTFITGAYYTGGADSPLESKVQAICMTQKDKPFYLFSVCFYWGFHFHVLRDAPVEPCVLNILPPAVKL